jgi:hypothetical protein
LVGEFVEVGGAGVVVARVARGVAIGIGVGEAGGVGVVVVVRAAVAGGGVVVRVTMGGAGGVGSGIVVVVGGVVGVGVAGIVVVVGDVMVVPGAVLRGILVCISAGSARAIAVGVVARHDEGESGSGRVSELCGIQNVLRKLEASWD